MATLPPFPVEARRQGAQWTQWTQSHGLDGAMREDEDWLDEQLRDILSGGAARRKITPDRLRRFEDRVAAKRRVGHDIAFQLRGA